MVIKYNLYERFDSLIAMQKICNVHHIALIYSISYIYSFHTTWAGVIKNWIVSIRISNIHPCHFVQQLKKKRMTKQNRSPAYRPWDLSVNLFCGGWPHYFNYPPFKGRQTHMLWIDDLSFVVSVFCELWLHQDYSNDVALQLVPVCCSH